MIFDGRKNASLIWLHVLIISNIQNILKIMRPDEEMRVAASGTSVAASASAWLSLSAMTF